MAYQIEQTCLLTLLKYDRRRAKGASKGLSLDADYPPLGLRARDRVEVCVGQVDAQDFEGIAHFPATVCFWRVSEETSVRHRNPFSP